MGYRDPQPTVIEDGPWRRMRDNLSPTARLKGALRNAQNVYPVAGDAGDSYVGRPGYKAIGARLGSGADTTVQGIFQYKKKDGSKYRIAIVGGHFYTLDWTSGVWTEVLTTAQLTAAAVTLSTSSRCAFLNFANVVIISDGVNLPWSWDGTTGGGITKLTNAPVIYGTLTMYFDRWFGRKASDPSTFVWSEASQPNVGFEAGFANAWTMVQTDSSAINVVVGTNDGLTAFRARSATSATGRPDANFQSQSTREGVAETEGSSSPWGYIQTERAIVFLDSDLHPQMTRAGGTLVPLWEDLYQTIRALPRAAAANAIAVNYTPAGLYLFALADVSAFNNSPNTILVYDSTPDVPLAVGVWRGFSMTALAMVDNGSDVPTLLHGYDGWIYEHGSPEGEIWDDFDQLTGTAAIEHLTETQPLGVDLKSEHYFDRLDVSLFATTDMDLDLYYETPRSRSEIQQLSVTGGDSIWDVDLWDDPSATWANATGERHGDAGLDGEGRWIVVGLRHAVIGQQFGINALAVTAFPSGNDPSVP